MKSSSLAYTCVFGALLLSACGRDKGETAAANAPPPPNLPVWAMPMMGRSLASLYADSTACKGHFDVVSGRVADPPSVQAAGWAWDTVAMKPVDRVLFINQNYTVVGAGAGGIKRLDVPAALPDVPSPTTGWSGAIGQSSGKVTAVALVAANKACVIGSMDAASGS